MENADTNVECKYSVCFDDADSKLQTERQKIFAHAIATDGGKVDSELGSPWEQKMTEMGPCLRQYLSTDAK